MAAGSYLNVKTDYGAAGNGTNNDTAPIRKAIEDAIRLGGATVYLPIGTYRITGLEVSGSFNMIGDGEDSVLLSDDRTRSVLKISNASGAFWRGFKIKSTAGTDYSKRNPLLNGLFLSGADRCTVEGLFVENTYAAGILVSGCTGTSIVGCQVRNTLADGIHFTGRSKDCTAAHNTLSETGDDGIAVVSYLGDKDVCERILITGNHVNRSWARGISHVGGRNVTIADNFVLASASSGILVVEDKNYGTYPPTDTVIHHNQVIQAGTYVPPRPLSGNKIGVEVASGASGVRIDGNTVKESKAAGLAVSGGGTGISIAGNHVYRNRATGVELADLSKVTFTGNTVELNFKYGLFATRVTYGLFTGNRWVNNNCFDMDNPAMGTPNANTLAIDNANFNACNDCTIADNLSVDDRTDRSRARVERAIEISGSRRIKTGGNRCYVYNADPSKAVTTESFLAWNAECERMDAFTGAGVPDAKIYKAGQFYFRTDTKELYLYDGSAWRRLALN
ncbi:right-handed parallel beta-helix repeat-containing protein [Cohnella candidum]|nr:right-handed parallel beta-helix repeat-containing protein [Cohnella candidum]